ncbi:amidohydrolase family protein, partial [Kitasatospora herbaricolor]|uniref:amidohydrolase family protein n=1 Tax=Kitasatospora herbaricolor TaxID=68217 RepID=UPI0036DEFECB
QAVREVRWVAGLDWAELAGIVADIRLDAADLHERVDELVPESLVVGVRHILQDLPPNAFTTAAHSAGLSVVAAHGLVFDATVRADQLAELATLHASAPSAVLVVDHLGNPPVHAGWHSADADAWRSGIRAVAREPNAYVKISGVSYSEQAAPFIREALDAFGFNRAMLGSDFPVTVTGERRWEQVADTLSPTAEFIEALRWRTANTVYGAQPRPERTPE